MADKTIRQYTQKTAPATGDSFLFQRTDGGEKYFYINYEDLFTGEGVVSKTYVNLKDLKNGTNIGGSNPTLSRLTPGQIYFISDKNVYVAAYATDGLSLNGIYKAFLPIYAPTGIYKGQWYTGIGSGSINIGDRLAYNGLMYQSLTGNEGTAPSGDAVNWLALTQSTANGYALEYDYIKYDFDNDSVIHREDKRGNRIIASVAFQALATNPIALFQWGNDLVRDNLVSNSEINCLNQRGSIYSNAITNGGGLICATNAGTITQNEINSGGSINATTNLGNISLNIIGGQSSLSASAQALTGTISQNTIINNSTLTATNNAGEIIGNLISFSVLTATNATSNSVIYGNQVNSNSLLTVTSNALNVRYNVIVNSSSITATSNSGTIDGNLLSDNASLSGGSNSGTIEKNNITNSVVSATTNAGTIGQNRFGSNIGVTANLSGGVSVTNCIFDASLSITLLASETESGKTLISGLSTFDRTLDLDTAIYNAGTTTLTIPTTDNYIGSFTLTSAADQTMTIIVNMPTNHESTFKGVNGKTYTFTNTAIGAAATNNMVASSGAGNDLIVGRTNGADIVVYERAGTFNRRNNLVKLT